MASRIELPSVSEWGNATTARSVGCWGVQDTFQLTRPLFRPTLNRLMAPENTNDPAHERRPVIATTIPPGGGLTSRAKVGEEADTTCPFGGC